MEIIDQQDSVLEEPFPGDNSSGENKQDSDIEEQTDSNATKEEEKRVENDESRQPDPPGEQVSGSAEPEDKSTQAPVTPDVEDHPDPIEEKPAAVTASDPGGFAEFNYSSLSREDLVSRLRDLLEAQSVQAIMTDVDNIKLNFYKKFKLETEAKRKKFVEEGGRIEDFKTPDDSLEIEIKELFRKFRERKTEFNRTLEQQKKENLTLKYEVIEKIKDLVNRKESINKTFNEFRDLQREWRSIGLVPQSSLKDMWETYHYHVEKFYDFIKINKELRDLDLKKNLEAKISLCEKAEELILEPSVVNAFKTLQKYHDQWREIGPVPTDKRTEIWTRFKEATYKVNSRHQQHFEDLKKSQKKNLEQKEILCEKAEDICNLVLKSHREWDDKSRELVKLQKVWRTIGFAPKKDNTKIYQRFREACDTFFSRKREFYAANKEVQQNNMQLKTELCIQAESLKESTEWKKTTEELIRLQKKWKEIGPAPKKQSDQIWKRFRTACDQFFERKSDFFKNIDKTYETNLQLKQDLIKEIEAFKTTDNIEANFKKLNEFQRRWTEIGFVPIKDKEALQDKYRDVINKHFDSLKIDDQQKNILKFRNRLNNLVQKPNMGIKLNQEREKYLTRLQQLRSDIVLWENNIGFFAKSKNAETMIQDVESKIHSAKETIKTLEMKIDMIDKADSDD